MVFSSNIFLFLFLPAFLAVYYLTPNRYRLRNWVVLLASYVFYAWWRVDFLFLFIAVTAWNYFIGLAIAAHAPKSHGGWRWMIAGVVVNLATLGYFKYANFGVDSFNALATSAGFEPFVLTHVILPIGISFYVFESISYIMDVYRGDAKATRHPVDFATFVALFPHLIAGPVFRYKDLADQFEERRHSLDLFGRGVLRFMQGFAAKVLIADSIAPIVSRVYALENPTTADAWLGALAYTAQLYFDFSGYSSMAIGLGLMMGFTFMENFDKPYISQSITEFWRRWHISLSSWLRDYLYISLGGNRGGTVKTYRNLFLTMFLGGLWHGANWTFVLWGAWHGVILSIERALGVKGNEQGFMPLRWLVTLLLVILGWIMFRAETVGDAVTLYGAMFRFDGLGFGDTLAGELTRLQLLALVIAGVLIAVELWRGRARAAAKERKPWQLTTMALLMLPLFALALLKLSSESYSPFLYFQF